MYACTRSQIGMEKKHASCIPNLVKTFCLACIQWTAHKCTFLTHVHKIQKKKKKFSDLADHSWGLWTLSCDLALHNQWNSTRFNTAAHLKAEITTVSSTPSCKLYLSSFWSDHNVVVCGPVEWMMIWGWIQHSKENHLLHLIAADISDHRHWQCTFTWKGFIQNQPVVHSVTRL